MATILASIDPMMKQAMKIPLKDILLCSNSFGEKIPSYTTLDAKLAHTYKGFRMTAEVNNILEEEYFEYGVSSTFSPGVYNAYPLPERTILFTVAKEFSSAN